MSSLYECGCDTCKAEKINLAATNDGDKFKPVLKAAESAFKYLHEKGGYKPEDLKEKPYKDLIDQTYKVFDPVIRDNEIPPEMLSKLQNDAFTFSGLKTHAQLLEASSLLLDEKGNIKSFSKFSQEFNRINADYNQNYLESERQFAINSSQMASNWAALDPNGRYHLQYRTANDDRVREAHRVLQDVTLPADDTFWLSYYPPNGWRCRCTAVEVLKDKYALSDSKKALEWGEKATSQIGKDGKNKLEMFRFNPGIQEKVFPPKHPYNKVKGAEEVKKVISEVKPIKDVQDLSNHFKGFAKNNPEYFQRSFKEINITKEKGVHGTTDMNGEISLNSANAKLIIAAMNNINNQKPTTLKQEIALTTIHHEMWHNANKKGNMTLTAAQEKTMELANEFVSRKTFPAFMEKLGGKLQNKDLTNDIPADGYNRMVKNYDQLIKWSGADPGKVLETVKDHLINGKYDEQEKGLIQAIKDHSKYDIEDKKIKKLVEISQMDIATEEAFKEVLESNNTLRKDRR